MSKMSYECRIFVVFKTVFMIDGNYFPAQSEPLPLRCSRARFRMKLFDFDEVEYNSVEGNFVKMERTRYGKFDYWLLQLQDKVNLLNILFPLTSGLFVRLLRLLTNRKFRYVEICLNPTAEEKITVLLDGVQVEPQPLELPKIKKMFA